MIGGPKTGRNSWLRVLCRHALIGICIGVLILLPHGVGFLYAQDSGGFEGGFQASSPFLDQLRGIEFGGLRIRPSFRQTITYDDNIFLNDAGEGEGREEDIISETQAGALLSFGLNVFEFDAKILPRYRYFMLHPEESTETLEGDFDFDFRIADLLDLKSDIGGRKGNRLFLETKNDVDLDSSPLDENLEPERLARISDNFFLKIGYELSKKAQIAGFYRLAYVESLENDFERINSLNHEAGLEFKYAVDPRLDYVAELLYGRAFHFERILDDSQYVQGLTGFEGQPARRLAFRFLAGAQHRFPIDSSPFVDENEVTALVFNGGATYEVGPNTRLGVDAIREIQLSTVSNFKTTTIGRVNVTHNFTPKITGVARAEVQHEEPSNGGESIRYKAGIRFDYRLTDWVHFDLEYEFQLNEAEERDADFYNNRVTLGMSLQF